MDASISPHKPTTPVLPAGRNIEFRVVAPVTDVTRLGGGRPITRAVSTGPANSDNCIRPLGYPVRAVTLVTPGSSSKIGPNGATGGNTDSVWVDLEEVSWSGGAATIYGGAFELVPGSALTWEEIDVGWLHFGSPTANQIVFIAAGGPSTIAPMVKTG